MKPFQLVTLSFAVVLLSACKPAAESSAPPVAETADATATVIELPIRYSKVKLDDLKSAEAMTALCESENQLMLDHIASLEGFDGKAVIIQKTIDGRSSIFHYPAYAGFRDNMMR